MKDRAGTEPDLEALQRAAFDYFLTYGNEATGLIQDRSQKGSPCSIAAVGFALSCYPVGVERGWIDRTAAATRTQSALRFFANSTQGPQPAGVTGHRGFYYHFLDMQTGERAWSCELSVIDTALLVSGALTAALYFDGTSSVEAEIRSFAAEIYNRIDFLWAQDQQRGTFVQGWTPEGGFIHYDWEGYSEAIILYVLAGASPHSPDMARAYHAWTSTYQWEEIYGRDVLYAGPLFIHLFSHAWIDFRGISDPFMAARATDYFQNTVQAIQLQRTYCRLNPGEFAHYGENSWGLSACDGPSGRLAMRGGATHDFYGYAARGVPHGPDDGTLVPWAPLVCLPFSDEASLHCLGDTMRDFPETMSKGRIKASFNPSLPGHGASGWVAPDFVALDQGLIVLMIENYRSGMIWKLTRGAPLFRKGLQALGFSGGWLG